MTRKRRRLWIVLACGLGLGSAAALALSAFRDNLVFFLAPSDIATKAPQTGRDFRLGGLVEQGSVQRANDAGACLQGAAALEAEREDCFARLQRSRVPQFHRRNGKVGHEQETEIVERVRQLSSDEPSHASMLDADTLPPAGDVTAGDYVLGRDADTRSNP